MAHEVKNSLTPIRLTVEEMMARYDEADRVFMQAATQICGGRNRDPGAAPFARSRNSPPSRPCGPRR